MATRKDITGLIHGRVGADRQGLNPDLYLDRGLRLYERYRPREIVAAGTGNGTEEVTIANISSIASLWVPGFSKILWLEYPVGDVPPTLYSDPDDTAIHDLANTGDNLETRVQAVIFRTVIPSNGETFRLKVTTRHTVNSTYSSVAAEDHEPLADFCAAEFFRDLARIYGGLSTQEGLGADLVVAYSEKADQARASMRDARRNARMALGLAADERDDAVVSKPSVASADFDLTRVIHGGRGALTHDRRRF